MAQQEQSRWWKSFLWTAGIVAALAFLSIVICGYLYEWKWTGLHTRTLWDWMKLLIIPAVLTGVGLWFNRQQRERELEIASQQRDQELKIAERRTQDEALQAYLNQMSQLLTDKDRPLHRAQPGDSLSTVAWAWTKTVLRRLGPERKGNVLRFVNEAGLINKDRPVFPLSGADLHEADLQGSVLRGDVNLPGANLSDADLSSANVSEADLSDANLSNVNLSSADLTNADLTNADLSGADLNKATGWTEAQFSEARSLKGATMPNGRKYEEWLMDKKAQGKDEKSE